MQPHPPSPHGPPATDSEFCEFFRRKLGPQLQISSCCSLLAACPLAAHAGTFTGQNWTVNFKSFFLQYFANLKANYCTIVPLAFKLEVNLYGICSQ